MKKTSEMTFYCVKRGFKPGIYREWADCQKQTKRFKNSWFKKFKSFDEAERKEMKLWIIRNKRSSQLANRKDTSKEEYHQLLHTSQFFMENLAQIIFHLETQQKDLEKDLGKFKTWDANSIDCDDVKEKPLLPRGDGIPEEALNLPCPDGDLRDLTLLEFHVIDIRYKERLKALQDKYQDVTHIFGNHPTGSWTEEDHSMFQSIYYLYMNDNNLKEKRRLCFDKLKRQFPHKTRMDLVAHETLWTSNQFYKKRHAELLKEWQRDRNELFCKIKLVFIESCMVQDLKEAKTLNEMKQKQICQELHEKVSKWRSQKLIAMQLQEELEDKKQEELTELHQKEMEKELHYRTEQKEKIRSYKEQLKREDETVQLRMEHVLEQMQRYLADQAEFDKKRVRMRSMMLLMKHNQRQRQQEIKLRQQSIKKKHLEKLKDQVEANVPNDPDRVFKETKAFQAKTKVDSEEANIHKPLFEIYSYTDKEILEDPRFILEKKLREADLLSSPYALKVLQGITSLRPPRPDQVSSIFKFDSTS